MSLLGHQILPSLPGGLLLPSGPQVVVTRIHSFMTIQLSLILLSGKRLPPTDTPLK